MPYIRDTVVVLRQEPFREQDVWLTLYGQRHGKMTAVARGALRSESKCIGHLTSLSEVEVMIAKGKTFDKLAVARLVRPRPYLRDRMTMIAVIGAIANLVDLSTRPHVADGVIYDLLKELLDLSQHAEEVTVEGACLLFESARLKLLDALGYAPNLHHCARCRTLLAEPLWFVADGGGMLLCGDCLRTSDVGSPDAEPFPLQTLILLQTLRRASCDDLSRLPYLSEDLLQIRCVVQASWQRTPLLVEPREMAAVRAFMC